MKDKELKSENGRVSCGSGENCGRINKKIYESEKRFKNPKNPVLLRREKTEGRGDMGKSKKKTIIT